MSSTRPQIAPAPQGRLGDTKTGLTGKVVRINHDRGFCFLTGGGQDYFCHFSALQNCGLADLDLGSEVTFDATMTEKGWRAELVSLV